MKAFSYKLSTAGPILLAVFFFILLVSRPSVANAQTATIQGYKVLMPRNQIGPVPPANEIISVVGGASSSANPYFLTVNAGNTYTVTATIPAGYTVAYTLCIDSITCHASTPTSGNTATVIMPSGTGHYADLWWHYMPIQNGIIQGVKIDLNAQLFSLPGATITVNGQSFGPSVNPYSINLPAGTYDVFSSLPLGYAVLYSLCTSCTNHPPLSYIPSNHVRIVVSSGSFMDLWWKYVPVPNQTSSWTRGEVLLKNFDNMYNAHILQEPGSAFPYKMWFFGWATDDCNSKFPGCDAIFYARSTDANKWEVYKGDDASGNPQFDATINPSLWIPVITAGSTYFDQWHVGDPLVIKVVGTYYMAFSSVGFDKDGIPSWQAGDTDGDYAAIMGAVSQDGIHWQKSSAPILAYSGEFSAKDPVPNGLYNRPSLLYEDGRFKLWFDYLHQSMLSFSMGYAELAASASPSVFLNSSWTVIRADNNPAMELMANPDIIHVGDMYYAYGDPAGYGDGWEWTARKITEAMSPDGITWKLTGFIDPEASCAASGVPEAYTENGKIYVTYGCQVGGNPYNFRYYQIRRMSKPLPVYDTLPPSVSIFSPKDDSIISGTVSILLSTSDNIGVSSVTISIDDQPFAVCGSFCENILWDTTKATDGSHMITATAFDAAGNSKTNSVTVTVANQIATTSNGPFTGQYYTSSDKKKFNSMVFTRTDQAINFDWGFGSPDPRLPSDNFAIYWDGTINFPTAGVYNFTATTDDGMKVWVDGVKVLNKWFNQATAIYNFSLNLSAGSHRVEVTYYEKTNTAVAKLSWVPANILGVSTPFTFTRNLAKGYDNPTADVYALQAILKKEGLFSVKPTGFFGNLTETAVKKLQAKYNIPQTGIVGPLTKDILNVISRD